MSNGAINISASVCVFAPLSELRAEQFNVWASTVYLGIVCRYKAHFFYHLFSSQTTASFIHTSATIPKETRLVLLGLLEGYCIVCYAGHAIAVLLALQCQHGPGMKGTSGSGVNMICRLLRFFRLQSAFLICI